ncbi:MAG: hypothetical protein AAGL17_19725 [Cyanobacteria bacterium J06576_12]
MPSYTYTGLDESITLRGVTFLKGEAVDISDPAFERKLDGMPYFSTDKPEAAKAVPESMENDSPEVQELKRKLHAVEAENASLRRQILELTSDALAEPEPEPEIEAEPVELESFDPTEPEQIEPIPDDWRDMHWKRQMVLAKKFTDMEINNQSDAVTAIEMELERRGG